MSVQPMRMPCDERRAFSGRWALLPDQAQYLYSRLSHGSDLPSTPFSETLALAPRLR